MNVVYKQNGKNKPLTRVINNVLTINLPSQYYIEQELKKLKIARETMNDPMINLQYKALINFINE
jgi:hypothetical protein